MKNENIEIIKPVFLTFALKLYGYTKKEYAKKCNITQYKLNKWNKEGVPKYAFNLLKQLAKKEGKHMITNRPKEIEIKPISQFTEKDLRTIKTAFWGKNCDPIDVVRKARRGNKQYIATILVNIFDRDAIWYIGKNNIRKNLDRVRDLIGDEFYIKYRKLT